MKPIKMSCRELNEIFVKSQRLAEDACRAFSRYLEANPNPPRCIPVGEIAKYYNGYQDAGKLTIEEENELMDKLLNSKSGVLMESEYTRDDGTRSTAAELVRVFDYELDMATGDVIDLCYSDEITDDILAELKTAGVIGEYTYDIDKGLERGK